MNALPPVPPRVQNDDDRPVGRFLSRREILALFGLGGVAIAAAACAPSSSGSPSPAASVTAPSSAPASAGASTAPSATASIESPSAIAGIPACVVVPELTEGPYYVDTNLERADIRPDTTTGEAAEGLPLVLTFLVSNLDANACLPLEGAVVDVWHCDALGVYSGVSGNSGDFLRGVQRTDTNGRATITTVYPGWYRGRAVHIHFKVRTDPDDAAGFELTSQLFLDDDLSRQVYEQEPYATNGPQDQANDEDGIFRQSDGTTLLDAQPSGDGYAATFSIALKTA